MERTEQAPAKAMPKKKRKKRWFILGALAIVVVVVIVIVFAGRGKAPATVALQQTSLLSRGSIQNTVNVTGVVKSASVSNVYSMLTYPVANVYVEVGDTVRTGDLLCKLDDSTLLDQIALKEASLDMTEKIAAQQARAARDQYNAARNTLDNGENTALINARQMLRNAERQLESVQETYDKYIDDYRGTDTEKELNDNLNDAKQAYTDALAAFEATQAALKQEVQAYYNNWRSSVLSDQSDLSKMELEQLRANLEKTNIVAPMDGTVTAVYANEGASGSGLLFIIEDTNRLVIETSVKEYDVGLVQPGMRVEIKSDITGDAVHEGEVESIAPTADKQTAGMSSDVQFATKVRVTKERTGLRIGGNARLYIVTAEQDDVYTVPYDAVFEDEAGQSYVMVLEESGENGLGTLAAVPVETGMENDLKVVISGDGLKDGMRVLDNANGYYAGQTVRVSDSAQTDSSRLFSRFVS